jgi:hypothetical protein
MHNARKQQMTTKGRNRITGTLRLLAHAVAAAGAVESGRKPAKRDLLGLGIDPDQFDRIGRG